jgi:hypothetical protein
LGATHGSYSHWLAVVATASLVPVTDVRLHQLILLSSCVLPPRKSYSADASCDYPYHIICPFLPSSVPSFLPLQSPIYKPLNINDQARHRHALRDNHFYIISDHYSKADLAYIKTLATVMGGL